MVLGDPPFQETPIYVRGYMYSYYGSQNQQIYLGGTTVYVWVGEFYSPDMHRFHV